MTRDALADVLGVPLIEHAPIIERLVQRFARRGLTMPEMNRRQALVIHGGVVLENPNGTAPGQMVAAGDRLVILLPGPPRELQPMMDVLIAGPLAARVGPEQLFRTTLFTVGRGESHVEEIAQPIYHGGFTRHRPSRRRFSQRPVRSSCTWSRGRPTLRQPGRRWRRRAHS